jgi:site-specific DNA-methyltransferase (adenine-specific)
VRSVRRPTGSLTLDDDLLVEGDCADVLPLLPAGAFDCVYVDPPFNTGARQELRRLGYDDTHDDYLAFLMPRLALLRDRLAEHGTLYVHLDQRESHYVKVALDELFGRDCFLNEIVWVYDYGGRSRRRWPAKHDTILVYVREAGRHHFDTEAVDREPYMAPGLVGPEKTARGKLPTDSWWHTIVPTMGAERTGYPTQKPEGIVRRMVAASSRPGGWCLDAFCGSGTLPAVATKLGRRFVGIDASADAIAVAEARLEALVAPDAKSA